MEDVIFAGTASRPSRDFAEVSLLIERRPRIPGDTRVGKEGEIEVTRRIERGAGSAYRVNGRDVRAKDVSPLFADAATGAHSPALVSQGRISAVIAAKPTERRQMLEEAAGISGLHVRRKDAEQKLRATEANLTRLDELLGDMETRAAALRRQAKAAERYRKLSDADPHGRARLIFARWREAAAEADAAKKEADARRAVGSGRAQRGGRYQRGGGALPTRCARAGGARAMPPRSATSLRRSKRSATRSPPDQELPTRTALAPTASREAALRTMPRRRWRGWMRSEAPFRPA
jgi:chromosome segregation protein